MNFRDYNWKRIIVVAGVLAIVTFSLFFTNTVAKNIAAEEEQNIRIWAEATEQISNEEYSDLAFNIIEQNSNIPVVVVDKYDNIITYRNFDIAEGQEKKFFKRELKKIKQNRAPIIIKISETEEQYVYFGNSRILNQLSYFPIMQMVLIVLFLGLLLWFFSYEKRHEQDKVWVGLSKETAHQLGTPISSLSAWQEILKDTAPCSTVNEMGKDIDRLKIIADRFSKIGSKPKLEPADISAVVISGINYMKGRTSQRVEYKIINNLTNSEALICEPLLQWVIENLCKNAVDAMNGEGRITINMENSDDKIVIEINDSGKGIEKINFSTIFKPGFTTKKSGWGLGLSLAKRIIEEYHHGKIFVKQSEIGVGTTFRIEL